MTIRMEVRKVTGSTLLGPHWRYEIYSDAFGHRRRLAVGIRRDWAACMTAGLLQLRRTGELNIMAAAMPLGYRPRTVLPPWDFQRSFESSLYYGEEGSG